jgi:hypothetical protein
LTLPRGQRSISRVLHEGSVPGQPTTKEVMMPCSFRLFACCARRFSVFGLSIAIVLLAPNAVTRAATPGDQTGVFSSGSVTYLFRICSTCPQPTGVLDSGSSGGFGSFGPAIVAGLGARGEGDGSFAARARILGSEGVPELRADARAKPGIGTHEGFSEPGFYDFNAVALARGSQYFTYSGTTTQTYTMAYSIDGFASSTLPSPTPEDESLISVSGGVTLFDDGDKLGGELPMGRVVDIDRISVNGSAHTFRQSGSVSITLDPGDSYYLAAFLSAQVSIGGQGIADAGHTLTIDFTAGNTAQLAPLLPSVPEPATYVLMSLGLGLTCLVLRRRRR